MIPAPDDPLLALFDSLAGSHVHYFPHSGNAGDGFISHATYTLLNRFDIRVTAHRQTDDVSGQTVLIGGGGNLVEGHYRDVAVLIERLVGRNRVILLPHTVVGFAHVLAHTHADLTVFCRDRVSHALALAAGANPAQTLLSHDMVFFLPDDHFGPRPAATVDSVTILRTDGESRGPFPGVHGPDISMSWNGDHWHNAALARHSTFALHAYLADHREVVTDRLHVAILGGFAGVDVRLLPNSYFKNRAVFLRSLADRFPSVRFADSAKASDAGSCQARPASGSGAVGGARSIDLRGGAGWQGAGHLSVASEEEWWVRFTALEAERDRLSRQLAELSSESVGLGLGPVAVKARLDASEKALAELQASRSWRLTAPLRMVSARLGR